MALSTRESIRSLKGGARAADHPVGQVRAPGGTGGPRGRRLHCCLAHVGFHHLAAPAPEELYRPEVHAEVGETLSPNGA